MSLDDGLVMQIHPGSLRNHNPALHARFGRDKGADIPTAHRLRARAEAAARPLRQRARPHVILFTLDETTYARELAPLAGHYPACGSGRRGGSTTAPRACGASASMTTETAGFYNTVGFNDDTRAFLSIPARHDVARRVDCAFLARLVAEHRLDEGSARARARTRLRAGPGAPTGSMGAAARPRADTARAVTGRAVCLGELLLRLSAPGRELLLQSGRLDVHVGGAEANVAVALACLGHDAAMVSRVPSNVLGDAAIGHLRRYGVSVDGVTRGDGRDGTLFPFSRSRVEVFFDRL